MTPLNKCVTSFEMSRRLKEAGIPQVSQFYWIETESGIILRHNPKRLGDYLGEKNHCSAFTVTELMGWTNALIIKKYYLNQGYGIPRCEDFVRLMNFPDELSEVLLFGIEKGLVEFK